MKILIKPPQKKCARVLGFINILELRREGVGRHYRSPQDLRGGDCPLISVRGDDRQWFKSKIGLEIDAATSR